MDIHALLTTDKKTLQQLEQVMREIINGTPHSTFLGSPVIGLNHEQRWKRIRKACGDNAVTKETVLEHQLKMFLIVHLMNLYEGVTGNPHNINFYHMLACSGTHDIGEAIFGDVDATVKNEENEKMEFAAFARIAKWLSPPSLFPLAFPQPFDRLPEALDIERKYWRAAEIIGYVMFAHAELRRPDCTEALKQECYSIMNFYRAPLQEASATFFSVALFYHSLYEE